MKLALGFLSAAILIAAVPLSLNYSGYCLSEQRFLTKEELIEIALRDVHYLVDYQGRSLNIDIEEIFKKNREYTKINPNCCKVLRNYQEYKERL